MIHRETNTGEEHDRRKEHSHEQSVGSGSDKEDSKVELQRNFTLGHGVTITMGLIIGLSVFVSPTGVIRGTGSGGMALVVWTLCGLISLAGALVFAELGTTFPRSGSLYVYLEEFYGPFPSFLFVFKYLLFFRPPANAVKCITFAVYVLQPVFSGCEAPKSAITLLAIVMAFSITFVNIYNVKLTAKFQNLLVLCTILSLCFIIAVAVYHAAAGGEIHLEGLFENTNTNPGEMALAFYSGLFAFGGWEALTFMVEEVKSPEKILPKSIAISVTLVTILYVTVNFCYQMVLGAEGIKSSIAVGSAMLQRVLGPGAAIMACLITFNMTASFNSGTLVSSRLGYVSARRGHMPSILSLIHAEYHTPIASLILQLILVVVCCIIGDVYVILNNIVFMYMLFKTLTVGGLIYHRIKYPNYHRPLKIPLFVPVFYFLCNVFLLVIPLVTKPMSCAIGLILTFSVATPYYILFVIKPFSTPTLDKHSRRLLRSAQRLLNALEPASYLPKMSSEKTERADST